MQQYDVSTAKRQSAMGTMKRLRVLFLPKNSRTPYFSSLLEDAHQRLDWDTGVVCPDVSRGVWRGALTEDSTCFLVPEFSERQAWENDPDKVADIDAFIGDCEQANGVSAGHILLAGERDLGRGFSTTSYFWFRNQIAKRVLQDNHEPWRITRRMFAFARDTLQSSNPDVLISGEWAEPMCFSFLLAARTMGIRAVVNRPSKIWSGRCYWSDDPMIYNRLSKEDVAERRDQNASVSSKARQRIKDFRSAPATLDYVKQNWDDDDGRDWITAHVDLARLLRAQIRYYLGSRKGLQPKPAFQMALEHYRQFYLKRRQRRFFRRFDENSLSEMRYIYFAMHKDPEQALNYQAPFWSNQYNTASLLTSTLPVGYRLLVREHRRNAGRRPTRYYKDISRLPGVVLIDGFDDQFKYSSNADLIVAETGSTGWEGLLLGRRVITLADNFYDGAGLARRVRDPEELAAAVVEMLEADPPVTDDKYDRALGWVLDAEWSMTTPTECDDYADTFELLARLKSEPAWPLETGDCSAA